MPCGELCAREVLCVRVRVVCTRVCAPASASGFVCTPFCLCTRVCSCDPVGVPTPVSACCTRVEGGAWTVRVGARRVHTCTGMRARVGDAYTPALGGGRPAHRWVFHVCICVLVGRQVSASLSCAPSVFDCHVHTRVRVCSLLRARERVHAPFLSHDQRPQPDLSYLGSLGEGVLRLAPPRDRTRVCTCARAAPF